ERPGGHRSDCDFDSRRLDEAVARNITGEQPCDFAAQIFVTRAGFDEERFARIRPMFDRRVIQLFDLFPAVTLHQFAPRSICVISSSISAGSVELWSGSFFIGNGADFTLRAA